MIVYFGIRQMSFTDLYFELKMQSTNLSVPFGFQSFFLFVFHTKNGDSPYKSLPIFIIS